MEFGRQIGVSGRSLGRLLAVWNIHETLQQTFAELLLSIAGDSNFFALKNMMVRLVNNGNLP